LARKKVFDGIPVICYLLRRSKSFTEPAQLQQKNIRQPKKFMKTIAKFAAILLTAAACAAGPAPDQTNAPASTNGAMRPKPRGPTFNATITSVDSANMILSLRGRPGSPDNKLKITSSTKIKKDGEPAQFSDALEGMRVRGAYTNSADGVWMATTLNIVTKPATPRAPPGTTSKPPE
jgi:hypothetical protein